MNVIFCIVLKKIAWKVCESPVISLFHYEASVPTLLSLALCLSFFWSLSLSLSMRTASLIKLSPLQLHTGGIIILKDTSEEEEELVEPVSAHGPKIEEEEQEPEPPEPFEYIDEWTSVSVRRTWVYTRNHFNSSLNNTFKEL